MSDFLNTEALEGLCGLAEEDYWFPPAPKEDGIKAREYPRLAKQICCECPVKAACLQHALAHEKYGIWAATSPKDRARIRKEQGIKLVEIRPDQRTYEGAAVAGAGV